MILTTALDLQIQHTGKVRIFHVIIAHIRLVTDPGVAQLVGIGQYGITLIILAVM